MMRHIKAFMINNGINQTEFEFIASEQREKKNLKRHQRKAEAFVCSH